MNIINNIDRIIEKVKNLEKPVIIGISGFGGCGKSTLANSLNDKLNGAIIGVDSFCKTTDNNEYSMWDIMDYERLENEVLIPFYQGSSVRYKPFDWENNALGQIKEVSSKVLIIEGVGLFRPELMKYFKITVWIDCSIEEAIKRGNARDVNEYGVDNSTLWNGLWKENDMDCFNRYLPLENVDFIFESTCREF